MMTKILALGLPVRRLCEAAGLKEPRWLVNAHLLLTSQHFRRVFLHSWVGVEQAVFLFSLACEGRSRWRSFIQILTS